MVTPMLCTGSFDSTEMYSNHTSENDKDLPNSIIHFTFQTSNFIFSKLCTVKTVDLGIHLLFVLHSLVRLRCGATTPHKLYKMRGTSMSQFTMLYFYFRFLHYFDGISFGVTRKQSVLDVLCSSFT